MESVYCMVRTGSLSKVVCAPSLIGLQYFTHHTTSSNVNRYDLNVKSLLGKHIFVLTIALMKQTVRNIPHVTVAAVRFESFISALEHTLFNAWFTRNGLI
jgi:hypothetical protein